MSPTEENGTTSPGRSTRGETLLWVVQIIFTIFQILLALMFLMAAGFKLAGASMAVEQFEKIGLGQWFRYLTGVLELIGAIALASQKKSAFGAVLLIPVMIGAVITHVFVFKDSPVAPLIFLVLLSIVAIGRWNQLVSTFRPSN